MTDPTAPSPPAAPASAATRAVVVAPVTPDDIRSSLASVVVQTSTEDLGEVPDFLSFNEIAYSNTYEKKEAFAPLHSAYFNGNLARRREAMEKAAEVARRWLKRNWKSYNRELKALAAEIAGREGKLAALRKQKGASQEAIDAEENQLAFAYHRHVELMLSTEARIDEMPLRVPMVRQNHLVTVGKTVVRLYDTVVTYATDKKEGMEGKAVSGDGPQVVDQALARSGLSAEKQEILRRISRAEGSFTTVNTWDRAVITFGFTQWTTGESGDGSLLGLFADIKSRDPALFRELYQRHGIDILRLGGSIKLKVTDATGTSAVGAAAAQLVQCDPKLVAVISAAGADPRGQDMQVSYASRTKIDRMLAWEIECNGKKLRIGDILNTTYGVGVMTDRAVQSGEGAVLNAVKLALKRLEAREWFDRMSAVMASKPSLSRLPALSLGGPLAPGAPRPSQPGAPSLAGPSLQPPDLRALVSSLPLPFGWRMDPTDPEIRAKAQPLAIALLEGIDPTRARNFRGLDTAVGSFKG